MPRYTMGLGPPAVTPGTWCPGGGAKRSDGKRVDIALLQIADIITHRQTPFTFIHHTKADAGAV